MQPTIFLLFGLLSIAFTGPLMADDLDDSLSIMKTESEVFKERIQSGELTPKESVRLLKELEKVDSNLTDSFNILADSAGIPMTKVDTYIFTDDDSYEDLRSEWLYFGPTYWGYNSNLAGFQEKIGFELGLSLPWLRGIDVGAHWGTLFAKGVDASTAYNVTLYLTRYKRGGFIGFTQLEKKSADSFGYLGYSFQRLYIKVDLPRGEESWIEPLVAFGYKWRI